MAEKKSDPKRLTDTDLKWIKIESEKKKGK